MHRQLSVPQSRIELFVLEDERGTREMISMVLTKAGFEVVCFADSDAFLATARKRIPAGMLIDVFVPGKSGIQLLKELQAEKYPAPVIAMSGRGDISLAVSAMKFGALDFIEKPFRGSELLDRITSALQLYEERQRKYAELDLDYFPGAEPLSRRERQVLEHFILGDSNKEAARSLGISPRTVEDHRSHIMRKLGARNYADLIRIVMRTTLRDSS
ncbi:response regulator transcription factor [Bradyrhizobium vignae]|uniref:response regulator transcription factor n=1 Tax=Bradyrhizobium vignae TaxID=1549949 RepID=UPI00100B85AC|nr:response regulator [Bradyrhizobium vignae]RXH02176.1 response regulator transcription factor [Bradyrhizobium vignae]